MARVLSVNIGRPRLVATGRRTVRTAIWKSPVEGRVSVRGVNLDGDDQADRSVHGGPDKAVYAYAIEETRAWEAELGRPLVGERWRIGTTLLEVVQPRLPCFKLGLRMDDPSFVRRFGQASRPGAYLRIVEEGELGAGDAIEVDVAQLPDHGVSVRLISDAILLDHSLIPQVLEAPQLLPELREWMTERG